MLWIRRFIDDRRGVVSIEFAITIIAFFMLVFFVAEIARMAYVSASIDLAVSESAKEAKNAPSVTDGGFEARFKRRLMRQGGKLWGFIGKENSVSVYVTYANSISAMAKGQDRAGNGKKMPLARYAVKYRYKSMFFPIPNSWVNTIFSREVIFVQEYERSKFME